MKTLSNQQVNQVNGGAIAFGCAAIAGMANYGGISTVAMGALTYGAGAAVMLSPVVAGGVATVAQLPALATAAGNALVAYGAIGAAESTLGYIVGEAVTSYFKP